MISILQAAEDLTKTISGKDHVSSKEATVEVWLLFDKKTLS